MVIKRDNIVKVEDIYTYTRVSTYGQADTGLPRQKEDINTWLHDNKLSSRDHYEDIGSSYNNDNALKSLNRLSRRVRRNDLVIISSISRLGRNTLQVIKVLEKFKRIGARIYAINENLYWNSNKYDNTKFQNIVIRSREKSDTLSLKSKEVHNYISSNGGYYGKPPYGFNIGRDDNNIPILVPNNIEIKTINFIKDQYENKKKSFHEIAFMLNDKHDDKRGYIWNTANVKYVYQHNLVDMESSMNSFYQPKLSSPGSVLSRSGSSTTLSRSGFATKNASLSRSGSNSSLHNAPESPKFSYKSKFKASRNINVDTNNNRYNNNSDRDSDSDDKEVNIKMNKLNISQKKGYGCTMF
jgi:DNA invertase Pin-like site-specific DNA recombinase